MIITYKNEAAIASQIKCQRSVAYVAGVDIIPYSELPELAIAANENINFKTPQTSDLHYTRSVFVSTTWNLNSDVFSPANTWAARSTPIDKPTNIEHDIDNKIGHITSQWSVDAAGELIDDSLSADEVPALFHVCNGAVIYKFWDKNQEKMDEFLSDLTEGKYSVSMEVLFNDFDYALRKDDDYHIITRDSKSSFLSAKLRAYGGEGHYDGYEVGRVLKNMNFSGKGYVKTPANPDSVIFSEDNISNFSFAKAKNNEFLGVYSPRTIASKPKTENITMSAELLEKQLADLQAELAEAKKVSEEAKAKLEHANASQFEEKIQTLNQELTKANAKSEEYKAAQACMCQKFDQLKAEKDELQTQFDTLLQTQVEANRVNAFVLKNYPREEAVAEAKKLASFSDENFEVVLSMVPDKKVEQTAKATTEESFVSDEESADATEDTEVETELLAPKAKVATATVEVEKEDEAEHKGEAAMSAIASRFSDIFNKKKKDNKENK